MASVGPSPRPITAHRYRQPILRVRTGCLTCRGRKKKCDEVKPVCAGCERNSLSCEWPTATTRDNRRRTRRNITQSSKNTLSATVPLQSRRPAADVRDLNNSSPCSVQENVSGNNNGNSGGENVLDPSPNTQLPNIVSEGAIQQHATRYEIDERDFAPDEIHVSQFDPVLGPDAMPSQKSSSIQSASSPNTSLSTGSSDHYDPEVADAQCTEWISGLSDSADFAVDNTSAMIPMKSQAPAGETGCNFTFDLGLAAMAFENNDLGNASVPRSMPLLSESEEPTYELLSFYMSRTAMSMGNGSTDNNPFVSQLIPLAFANKFILGLVLCQSAVHRATEATEDPNKLTIAQKYYNNSLRSFRKCIDEYITGQEINPLWLALGVLIMCFTETAKGDIHGTIFDHIDAAGPLLSSLMSQSTMLPEGLRSFIVEYYVNLVTISMISIDPSSGSPLLLNPQFESMAEQMVANGYMGQLCGAWLELLLLVPRIYDFAWPSKPMSEADRFLTFSHLQIRILSFVPSASSKPDTALCGHIFKQAVHIYLLTALAGGQSPEGQAQEYVDSCVTEAFDSLWQLPADARINTSLCWALAVIGSCVHDEVRQNELRTRLDATFLKIGLGNIRSTAELLQKVWNLPVTERSPWAICRVMREHKIWMSFV